MRVVGVDGCRGGWVSVVWDTEQTTLTPSVHASFAALLDDHQDAAAIGIDIPIGLSHGDRRVCDVLAKKMLQHRHMCVFYAPDPRVIDIATHAEASALARELTGSGVSIQAYGIFPKISEVNQGMTPELQDRVIEVHPEVSFCAMAGQPMNIPKRRSAGFEERRITLLSAMGSQTDIWTREEAKTIAAPAKPDDILDALVVAWTACRFAEGRAERMPAEPPVDRHGLRMEIVY